MDIKDNANEVSPKKEEFSSYDRVYTIPFRDAWKKSVKKRCPYAMQLVKKHITIHTKKTDIKIGCVLNDTVWNRGINHPPRRVKVGVKISGDQATVELFGHEYKSIKAKKAAATGGSMRDKLMARLGPKALQKQAEEEKIEGRKKEESGEKKQKDTDKDIRHEEHVHEGRKEISKEEMKATVHKEPEHTEHEAGEERIGKTKQEVKGK